MTIFRLLLCLFFFSGCAALPPAGPAPERVKEKDPFEAFAQTYRTRAVEHEKREELYKALFMWQVVLGVTPDDGVASRKVKELQQRIQTEADYHFVKGLQAMKKNLVRTARKEFLIALAYDPRHDGALFALKQANMERDTIAYEIKSGDTYQRIAQNVYRDPEKDFVVAYFSGPGGNEPKTGTILRLPVIDPKPKVKASVAQRAQDKASAESHYKEGMKLFVTDDLEAAILEWEETLRLNPSHPNAKRDVDRARNMLQGLESK
jgi:tetratricopeptide (TPR) repeat protein